MQDLRASGKMAKLATTLGRQSDATRQAERLIGALGTYARLNAGALYGAVDLSEAARLSRAALSEEIAARRAKVDIADMPVVAGRLEDITLFFKTLIDNGFRHYATQKPLIGISEHNRALDFEPHKRLDSASRLLQLASLSR